MKSPSHRGIAIAIFAVSLLVAASLQWSSEDYVFPPAQADANYLGGAATQDPADRQVAAMWTRSTGTITPGSVQVRALLLNVVQPVDYGQLVFEVAMDTHTVDLAKVDLSERAILEDSYGGLAREGFSWKVTGDASNHHIVGVLVYELDDRTELSGYSPSWIELTLVGIPAIQNRKFRWLLQG